MEHNREHIDDLFKKELSSYTEAPPPTVWDALEKRLDEKNNRRSFVWLWFILIGAVAVSLGILFAGGGSAPKVIVAYSKKDIIPSNPVTIAVKNTQAAKIITLNNSTKRNLKTKKSASRSILINKHKNNSTTHSTIANTANQSEITSDKVADNTNLAVATGNAPDIEMTNQVTIKGNIHVEQEVIKTTNTGTEEKSTPLLASNANGLDGITSVKKHGIAYYCFAR